MKKLLLILALIGLVFPSNAKLVEVKQYGLLPNAGVDARPILQHIINEHRSEVGVTLLFEQGRYDFYPEDSDEKNIFNRPTTVGIQLEDLRNFTLDGRGAEFVFHGKMQIALVNRCLNLRLENFSVDWDRPFISQAEILSATDDYLEIKVDKSIYPYTVKNEKVFFRGEGWELPIMTMYSTLYDKKTKEIAYNTWDSTLGDIFEQRAEETAQGIIRFYGKPKIQPVPSEMMVALFHVRYFASGIVVNYSEEVLLRNIQIYHSLSNAFLGYRSTNITMDNASVVVNDDKGRYFSSVADASHFSECAGMVRVLNCAHTGQGDDFINVHGTSVRITSVLGSHTLTLAVEGKGNGGSVTPGDEYWFIRLSDAQRGAVGKIVSKRRSDDGKSYIVVFEQPIPNDITPGDFLECKTWCAGLEMRNCRILKRHRARGVLVTSPKKVIIEDNYFATAGTAILIEGDFNYWYESGACENVLIRNNVFDNCLTSGNKHGSRAEWGEAVITITPSHIPKTIDAKPYHKNIRIENNLFNVFDAPLLRAVSTGNITFTNNAVKVTSAYAPYAWQKAAFMLDGCRDVRIQNNFFDDKYLTRDIWIERLRPSEVVTDSKDKFQLKSLNGVDNQLVW